MESQVGIFGSQCGSPERRIPPYTEGRQPNYSTFCQFLPGPQSTYAGGSWQGGHQGCTPRPAPPRAKMAAPARPDPEKFQHCPAPPRKKIVLPRPENIDRMFRGKVRGKCSYITKRFCESKTFEQYFLAPLVLLVAPKVLLIAPKVLFEDIQITPIHF